MENYEDLMDILSDDDLFSDFETDIRLFNTERYESTVSARSTSSARKRFKGNFGPYSERFSSVQAEIASGIRRIVPISEAEISKKSPIKQGSFYIDNGIMLYINKIYNPDNLEEEILESSNRKYKVHVIFENGTENHIWLLSLISSLYDRTRGGRLVTDNISEIEMLGYKNVTTGYIYVVQYAGDNMRLRTMKNLYKIGFAKDVKIRLSNTQNQSTYLYAPVHLVAQYEIQNVDAQKIERALHHQFSSYNIQFSVETPDGRSVEAIEWFIVSREEIEARINQIIVDIQK